MGVIITRSSWARQPTSIAKIDGSSPYRRGLVFCADIGPGGIADAISGARPDSFLGTIGAAGGYLSAYLSSASVSNWQWGDNTTIGSSPVNSILSGASQSTVDILFRSRNTSAAFHLLSQWNIGSGNHWLVQVNGTGLVWVAAEDGSGNRRRWDGSSLFTQNKWHRLILSWQGGSSLSARLDGVDITGSLSAVDSVATSIRAGAGALRIAPDSGGTPDVDVAYARVWNRGLSSAETAALATGSPWAIYAPLPRRIWVPSAVGAPSHAATGALSGQSATIAGTATHLLLHTSTGALSGQSATIAGTALHPHTSSGALSAGSATIAGAALHPHTSTGALAAQAATIAGTAARSAAGTHDASGALTGQSATIAGAALHPHTSTGALSGQAASIAGAAAKTTVHPSTGALAGQAATIAGTANHTSPVTHTSTGALVASAAFIAGAAALNGGVTGVGSYEDAPRKRRFIQQVGNKLVVFNNAGAAIKALVAEEDRLAALAQSEADEAEKAAEYVSPDDVELPETIAASEVEETIPIAEIQQLAQRDDETDRINTLVKQQEYDALLALYHVLQERADDEATIEMLLMSL